MSGLSGVPPLGGARPASPVPRLRSALGVVFALAAVFALGAVIGQAPLLALLIAALALVVLALPLVDQLSVAVFWLLPYLILNIPAGGVTLKVPEAAAYLFAAAAMARALLRREPVALPPATPQVLLYLGVVAISAIFAPPVPATEARGLFGGLQGPDLRPGAILFWLALSWLVVVSLYHVVGTSPTLYRRCLCAHVLSGGVASLIGVVGYVLSLRGYAAALQKVGNGHAFVYNGGSFYRLTGVSYEPLLMAFYLCSVIPVGVAVALFRPDWLPRWLVTTALILQALALLMTFSAGGWVALAAVLLLMAVLLRPKPLRWKRAVPAIALFSALGGGIAAAYVANPIIGRTMNDAVRKIVNGGYKMRDDENLTGMRIFDSHFWLGVGPGMTPFHFLHYHPVSYTVEQAVSIYVNNLYIATLADTGIFGLAALLICGLAGTAALAKVILRHGPRRVPMLTALTGALIGCAIQYWETQNLFLIYFTALIGLTVAGARLASSGVESGTGTGQEAPWRGKSREKGR